VSETKETESGAEAQADRDNAAAPEAKDAQPSGDAEAEVEAEAAPEAAEAEAGEGTAAPKKKKKKAREEAEPENIRDRNARVRAEAAEKRRARREREQGTAPKRNLDASEIMDDALARSTHAAAGFLTKHFNKVQWVVMAGLAGWIAFEVYSWRHARTTEKATDTLFQALSAEMGKVGSDEAEASDERGGPVDARRSFSSDEERLKVAKKEYLLASGSMGSPGSVLADLGAAGVAYDLGEYKDAQAAFEKVKQNPAFASDRDIKGRTLEGIGMALEAQKNEDGALKAFHELANMDVASFAALGMYHQARILKGQGKKDDAVKLLEKAVDKLATLKETPAVIKYVGSQVLELIETLDPKKARELGEKLTPSDAMKKLGEGQNAAANNQKLSAEMQKRIQEMMEKQQQQPAPMPGPVAPPQDAPAPDTAPQDAPPTPAPAGSP
jgi:tetratricopeptide (TPR) repeat protein